MCEEKKSTPVPFTLYNQQYTAVDDGNGGTVNVLTAYDVDYYLIDVPTGNPIEGGGPERADTLYDSAGNDHIMSGGGNGWMRWRIVRNVLAAKTAANDEASHAWRIVA